MTFSPATLGAGVQPEREDSREELADVQRDGIQTAAAPAVAEMQSHLPPAHDNNVVQSTTQYLFKPKYSKRDSSL